MAKPPRPAGWVDQLGRWMRPASAVAMPSRAYRPLALGLQGGGALGAFTWGVLDRLLDEPGLPLSRVSGASAGAVNGAVLVSHWVAGGAPAAQRALERLWRRLSDQAAMRHPAWLNGLGQSAGALALDLTSRLFSPYQLNPLDRNPLRDILVEEVDFSALADPRAPALTIAATRIADGTARLFQRAEITLDAIIASASLPLIHQAVEIDGEAYWDGGYAANPPLMALVAEAPVHDLLVVQLNPARHEGRPKTAPEIVQRLNQIIFNQPLLAEWSAIEPKAAADGFRLHRLVIEPATLPAGGALTLDWAFLEALRDQGRSQADLWIKGGGLTRM